MIVVRLTADKPGAISFSAELRGIRNTSHSNYANDVFTMDGLGDDRLILRGKSADYLGIEGKLRYEAQLKAQTDGGDMRVEDDRLIDHRSRSSDSLSGSGDEFRELSGPRRGSPPAGRGRASAGS